MAFSEIQSGPGSPYPSDFVIYGSNFCDSDVLGDPRWWNPGGGNGDPDLPYLDLPNTSVAVSQDFDYFKAQFGADNNPLQVANFFEGVYSWSNTLGFNLIGPIKMVVQSDVWDYCEDCLITVRRKVTYQVVNSDGSVAVNIPLGEVNDYGTSTCDQGRPPIQINSCTVAPNEPIDNPSGGTQNISGGMWATDTDGTFTDGWTMGTDGYTPNRCGFPVNYDHWELCGLQVGSDNNVTGGVPFGTLTGFYHNIQVGIYVGLGQYVLPPLFVPCNPNKQRCPGSLPIGTAFTP